MTDKPRRDGRVVPVYALTGGRTRAGDQDLPIESLVSATDESAADLQPEYRAIIALARQPVSLIEVSATIAVPIGVVRVLVSDLASAGHLVVHTPPRSPAGGPSPQILGRLLDGLRGR
jgi:hypothetical protein